MDLCIDAATAIENLSHRLDMAQGERDAVTRHMIELEQEVCRLKSRLAAYKETGVEPEDLKRAFNETASLKLAAQVLRTTPDHLRDLLQAEQDGRLVVLDEPMRPLVWGDKEHDTILCPRCLCDLMGGFEYAPSCETVMFQCPHCGQPIKSDKAIDMDQSEAEAALKGGEG